MPVANKVFGPPIAYILGSGNFINPNASHSIGEPNTTLNLEPETLNKKYGPVSRLQNLDSNF
jgi:hypothetical protein